MPKSQVPLFATVWSSTAEAIDDGMHPKSEATQERRIEGSPRQRLTLTPNRISRDAKGVDHVIFD